MGYVKFLFALAAIAATCNAAAVSKKLNVDLYYESLCPGCRALITGQLVDVAAALDEYLNINLVPFGNARYQGKTIVCQHGEEECLGNKIHACAIKRLNNQLQQVQFVGCMDKIPSVEDGGKQCSAKFNLEWEDVQSCANGSEGEALHASYGKATLALSPTNPFVPVVAIDGYRGETSDNFLAFQEKVENQLLSVLCQKLKEKGVDLPGACISVSLLRSYA